MKRWGTGVGRLEVFEWLRLVRVGMRKSGNILRRESRIGRLRSHGCLGFVRFGMGRVGRICVWSLRIDAGDEELGDSLLWVSTSWVSALELVESDRCEVVSMSWVLRGGWLVRVVSGVGSMIRLARWFDTSLWEVMVRRSLESLGRISKIVKRCLDWSWERFSRGLEISPRRWIWGW